MQISLSWGSMSGYCRWSQILVWATEQTGNPGRRPTFTAGCFSDSAFGILFKKVNNVTFKSHQELLTMWRMKTNPRVSNENLQTFTISLTEYLSLWLKLGPKCHFSATSSLFDEKFQDEPKKLFMRHLKNRTHSRLLHEITSRVGSMQIWRATDCKQTWFQISISFGKSTQCQDI